jgi:hypothetical protein
MAQMLFDEGKRRMAVGDYAGACPKLAESYRLDPGSGTLTALAVCHEDIGKTASAWTEFIQVVSEARQAGRTDREKFAQRHIRAIEPKLVRLAVVVDPVVASLSGLEVRRDGTILGQAAWGTAAPVDPGEHTVEARATGKIPWSLTVAVGPSHDIQTVTVRALEDLPDIAPEARRERVRDPVERPPVQAPDTPPADGPTRPTEDGPSSLNGPTGAPLAAVAAPSHQPVALTGTGQRTVGLAVGGVGLVAAGAAIYFGPRAISKSNQAKGLCPNVSSCANPEAVSINDDARSSALAADIALGASLAALAGGAVIYFTAPSARPPTASTVAFRFLPVVSTRGGSLMTDARW